MRSTMRAFREVKVIGKGSFGEAIMVQRRSDNAAFVIKKVPLTGLPEKERAEAANEVAVLDALQHPHIVRYFEAFEERGCLHIVLEYADSGDLSQQIEAQKKRVDGAPFTEAQLLGWFAQTASALQYVHSLSMLHRDIKTANIFLKRERSAYEAKPRIVVKLGDFGIAKQLANEHAMAQTVIGTPYYMSPELCEDMPYDQKSDVWALGCVLYELAMLRHAFDALNLGALVRKIMASEYAPLPVALDPPPQAAYGGGIAGGPGAPNGRRPPARGASGGFSPALGQLVALMLARDPADRPDLDYVLSLPLVAPYVPRVESGPGMDALAQTRAGFRAPRALDATVAHQSRRTDMGQGGRTSTTRRTRGQRGAGSSPSMPGSEGRAKAQRRHSALDATNAPSGGRLGGGTPRHTSIAPRRRSSLVSASSATAASSSSSSSSFSSPSSASLAGASVLSPAVSTGPFGSVGSVVEALRRGKWTLARIEGSGGGTFTLTTLEGSNAPASASGVPRRALRIPDAAARARLAVIETPPGAQPQQQTPTPLAATGARATDAVSGASDGAGTKTTGRQRGRQHGNGQALHLVPLADTDEDEATRNMGATAVSPRAQVDVQMETARKLDATAPRAPPPPLHATRPQQHGDGRGEGGFGDEYGGGGNSLTDLGATIKLDATIRTPKGGDGSGGFDRTVAAGTPSASHFDSTVVTGGGGIGGNFDRTVVGSGGSGSLDRTLVAGGGGPPSGSSGRRASLLARIQQQEGRQRETPDEGMGTTAVTSTPSGLRAAALREEVEESVETEQYMSPRQRREAAAKAGAAEQRAKAAAFKAEKAARRAAEKETEADRVRAHRAKMKAIKSGAAGGKGSSSAPSRPGGLGRGGGRSVAAGGRNEAAAQAAPAEPPVLESCSQAAAAAAAAEEAVPAAVEEETAAAPSFLRARKVGGAGGDAAAKVAKSAKVPRPRINIAALRAANAVNGAESSAAGSSGGKDGGTDEIRVSRSQLRKSLTPRSIGTLQAHALASSQPSSTRSLAIAEGGEETARNGEGSGESGQQGRAKGAAGGSEGNDRRGSGESGGSPMAFYQSAAVRKGSAAGSSGLKNFLRNRKKEMRMGSATGDSVVVIAATPPAQHAVASEQSLGGGRR